MQVAVEPTSATVFEPVHSAEEPSLPTTVNVTLPAGAASFVGPVTVAVSLTAVPGVAGLALVVTTVEVVNGAGGA